MRNRGLLLLTVLTVVVALVITLPARIAYKWMSPPFVQISGIYGTVWNGGAREFATNGVYLRELTWHMRPLALFTGKARYDISGTPVSGFFASEVTLSLGGTLTLSNLSASVPLQMFEEASNIVGLRGTASLQFERLELAAGRASAMDGTVDIANLRSRLSVICRWEDTGPSSIPKTTASLRALRILTAWWTLPAACN